MLASRENNINVDVVSINILYETWRNVAKIHMKIQYSIDEMKARTTRHGSCSSLTVRRPYRRRGSSAEGNGGRNDASIR
jgi:hypothetical protein